MMHFAADGMVATRPIEGGIEITREQYLNAIAAMTDSGAPKLVSIENGVFALIDPPQPEPDPEPVLEPDTPEQIIERFRVAIQAHVDETARSRNYDSGNSLASYVASTNPQWAAEATAFIAWRDEVWEYSYAELDKVMAAEREQPAVEAFIIELPVIAWPVEDAEASR